MSYFKCPNCNAALHRNENTFRCVNKHSFDCAKSGYVNLLQAQNSKQHGDDLEMLRARKSFLDKGHYQPLADKLIEIIRSVQATTVLDAGSGEGWYVQAIEGEYQMYGVEISKNGCNLAAKRNTRAQFAVGSTFDIPLLDQSMDVVYSVFAPFSSKELARVLKPKGVFIHVYPLEDHLLQLKQAVYDTAYLNQVESNHFPEFNLQNVYSVRDIIQLNSNSDIHNLFQMTPYVYRTQQRELEKLGQIHKLNTEISFGISVYQKN